MKILYKANNNSFKLVNFNLFNIFINYIKMLSIDFNHHMFIQLGPKKVVPVSMVESKWLDLTMPKELFDDLIRIGNFSGNIQWSEFLALAASSLASVCIC